MSRKIEEYINAFKAADKDGSGTLSRNELVDVLRQNGVPASKMDKLMKKFDLNGDGIVSFGEYKIALNISSQPMHEWEQLFHELDKDNSGSVDAEEFKVFLRSSGSSHLEEVVNDWIADYDLNKDGKLEYKEFLGFVASLED